MSGGRFLEGLRHVTSSEKIIKIKSLLKEDLDIDNVKVDNTNDDETTSRLLSHTNIVSCSPEHLCLSDDSRGSSTSYCRLHCEKVKKRLGNCCKEHLSGNLVPENSDFSYLQILPRGGLTIPSINLVNYVCTAFAILDYSQRQSVFYVIFHQITLSNIHAAYMSQLGDVFVTVQ